MKLNVLAAILIAALLTALAAAYIKGAENTHTAGDILVERTKIYETNKKI